MDAPIWSNDALYLREMIVILSLTAIITFACFYISKRSDRRRQQRLSQAASIQAGDTFEVDDANENRS
jgi:preprotein translocase subunit YajC